MHLLLYEGSHVYMQTENFSKAQIGDSVRWILGKSAITFTILNDLTVA